MMNNFYSDIHSPALRFGDIIHGYIFVDALIKKPFYAEDILPEDYNIKISFPKYCVILTPCCRIEKSVMNICPLEKIKNNFLKNNYFKEELTRINRRMSLRDAFTQEEWNKLSDEAQANAMLRDYEFSNLQNFIYAPHPYFESYIAKKEETSHYMIDFKNTIKIKCDLIQKSNPSKTILDSKIAELSIDIRHELREKISNFYARVPEEDKIEVSP